MSNSTALTAGTNLSGVTVVGSKTVMAANSTRRGGIFQNISDTAMSVNVTGETATATNSLTVPAGGSLSIPTASAVSVFCTIVGKAYVALEYSR